MYSTPNGIRKAAILVSSLDRSAADSVLERMDPQQAAQLRRMMVELDRIDPGEQRQIIDEFFRIGPMVPGKEPPGIELDGRLAQRLSDRGIHFTAPPAEEESTASDGSRFRFLHEAEGDKLAKILAAERPQTIALVLSHLPPEQAGSVLAQFPAPVQVEVIRRLVDLEETAPEILQEVEKALESKHAEQLVTPRRQVAGLSAVSGILAASDERVGAQILDNLVASDHELAERLAPPPLDFDDLVHLDDHDLSAVFKAADHQLVLLALVGASPEMLDRILEGLSEWEARQVRRRLHHFGPTRLSDVEEARHRITQVARRLAVQRRIKLSGSLSKSLEPAA